MKIDPALRHRLRKKIVQEIKKPSKRNVTVTSAVKMSKSDIENLKVAVPELASTDITNEVDESIIGGLVIVDGSKIIDVSIRGRIKDIVNSLLNK